MRSPFKSAIVMFILAVAFITVIPGVILIGNAMCEGYDYSVLGNLIKEL